MASGPNNNKIVNEDLSPITLLLCKGVNDTDVSCLLKALLDSGGTKTMVHRKAIPRGCTLRPLSQPIKSTTINGTFETTSFVVLRQLALTEFDPHKVIDEQDALVFDGPARYDIILGRDFLQRTGMTLDFELKEVRWLDLSLPMRSPSQWDGKPQSPANLHEDHVIDTRVDQHTADIQEAEYDSVDPAEVARQQQHLTDEQRKELETLFGRYDQLFRGELGRYPGKQLKIEIDPTATPKHSRPYSVPRAHEEVFKKELRHLVELGVLRRCGRTDWAAGTFIIPKKDGRVRWISDFRELNKVVRRRVYPLPRIQEILTRRPRYAFFTKLDISMQYYTFELDNESKELCTIVTPFGKYQYCRLPMGICCAPDMAQEIMEDVLDGVEDAEVYLDDIGVFGTSWTEHLQSLDKVLDRLQRNGFTVNPRKCEWAVQETDWLGYWLTPVGLKPWQKKVDGITALQAPTNMKELRAFLGAVNYYRDMWPRRSHLLQPLTDLTGKGEWRWTPEHQAAFDEMKAVAAADALMAYPDHNKPFDVYTDASDYQVGACIIQDGKPVAYYSRKLSSTQQRYTTMEKELLAIVLTLSEFRTMLLGSRLTVYTDHKNLTYSTLNSNRVLRWRLFLEEYGATYVHIDGDRNVLADAFSRLPRMDPPSEGKGAVVKPQAVDEESLFASIADNDELLDCFVNLPAPTVCRNPHDMKYLQQQQFMDPPLLQKRNQRPNEFPVKYVQGIPVICRKNGPADPEKDWKVCLPTAMLQDAARWYHLVLGHAGTKRMFAAITKMFFHPNINWAVNNLQCDVCQQFKLTGAGFGKLPAKEAILMPWEEVHVDLIGPWKIKIGTKEVEFNALTCIDPVTNLVEMVRIENKTSKHVAQQFENCWLARYPWPEKCVHDKGKEFVGLEFQQLLQHAAIKDRPTTSRNPQANAVCERMHQTVGNILRTLLHGHPPNQNENPNTIIDNALATAMHATRTAVSQSLGNNSPGSLAFKRDMFLNVPLLADLQTIRDKRQTLIDENLRRQNEKRRGFDYEVGQRVLLKQADSNKLGRKTVGPYLIVNVHTNGTITIRRSPHVTERINIRRVVPYRE